MVYYDCGINWYILYDLAWCIYLDVFILMYRFFSWRIYLDVFILTYLSWCIYLDVFILMYLSWRIYLDVFILTYLFWCFILTNFRFSALTHSSESLDARSRLSHGVSPARGGPDYRGRMSTGPNNSGNQQPSRISQERNMGPPDNR